MPKGILPEYCKRTELGEAKRRVSFAKSMKARAHATYLRKDAEYDRQIEELQAVVDELEAKE